MASMASPVCACADPDDRMMDSCAQEASRRQAVGRDERHPGKMGVGIAAGPHCTIAFQSVAGHPAAGLAAPRTRRPGERRPACALRRGAGLASSCPEGRDESADPSRPKTISIAAFGSMRQPRRPSQAPAFFRVVRHSAERHRMILSKAPASPRSPEGPLDQAASARS